MKILYEKRFHHEEAMKGKVIGYHGNYFCPDCREIMKEELTEDQNAYKITCTKCGKTFIKDVYFDWMDEKHINMERLKNQYPDKEIAEIYLLQYKTLYKTLEGVYYFEENNMLSWYRCGVIYVRTKTGKLIMRPFKETIKVNLSTGRMYYTSSGRPQAPTFSNLGYGGVPYQIDHLEQEAVNVLMNFFLDYKGLGKREDYDAFISSIEKEISLIAMLNRFPNMILYNDTWNNVRKPHEPEGEEMTIKNIRKPYGFMKHVPCQVMDHTEFVKHMEMKLGLPKGNFHNLYMQNPLHMLRVYNIMEWGIKQPDNIRRVLPLYDKLCKYHSREKGVSFCRFMKKFVKACGETAVVRKIEASERDYLSDCETIYTNFIVNHKEQFLPEQPFKGNIKEMHDRLSHAWIYIPRENLVFSWRTKEEKLQGNYEGLDFILPKDSRDLAKCGKDMGICVGSYDRAVASGKTLVIFAMEKGKYKVCISIEDGRLDQVKTKFNGLPGGKLAEAVKQWANDKKIDTRSSEDFARMGEEFYRWGKQDFHCIEPEEFGIAN